MAAAKRGDKERARDRQAALCAAADAERSVFAACAVDIRAAAPGASFHVLLDGALFGPFARVRLGVCRAASAPLFVPVMSYTSV